MGDKPEAQESTYEVLLCQALADMPGKSIDLLEKGITKLEAVVQKTNLEGQAFQMNLEQGKEITQTMTRIIQE